MKKGILITIVIVLALIVGYKLFFNKDAKPEEPKDKSLSVSKPSGSLDSSFSILMNDYYAVKDALVNWDSNGANQAALLLQHHADSLTFSGLTADSAILETARNFASSVSSESKGLIGETNIEQKRRALNMLTDEMYNLIRTIRYNGQVVYHIKCPMAFNDSEEAYWLSSTNKVVNPYLGTKHPKYHDKMIGCGEVVDSLDFAKK
jgi:hypothetical protein